MTWIYLVVAGILEVVWATALKMSQGFSQLGASVVTVVGMILSFVFLGLAVKHLPLSLAYPIWTGIGAVGSILVGVICFRDRLPAITWLFVALLVIGIVGIKVTSGKQQSATKPGQLVRINIIKGLIAGQAIDPLIGLTGRSQAFSRVSTTAAVEPPTLMYQKKHKPASAQLALQN